MDLRDEKGSRSIEASCGRESSEEGELKSCTDCRTTKTPLWRGGPSGPKSLCNACGIRYRKKRRGILGLKEGGGEKERGERGVAVKLQWLGFGGDVVLKQRTMVKRRRMQRKLREEEEAAFLLMALSSGNKNTNLVWFPR